jgi:hypothetical protein
LESPHEDHDEWNGVADVEQSWINSHVVAQNWIQIFQWTSCALACFAVILAAISAGRAVRSVWKALVARGGAFARACSVDRWSIGFVPQSTGIVSHVVAFSSKMFETLDASGLLLVESGMT